MRRLSLNRIWKRNFVEFTLRRNAKRTQNDKLIRLLWACTFMCLFDARAHCAIFYNQFYSFHYLFKCQVFVDFFFDAPFFSFFPSLLQPTAYMVVCSQQPGCWALLTLSSYTLYHIYLLIARTNTDIQYVLRVAFYQGRPHIIVYNNFILLFSNFFSSSVSSDVIRYIVVTQQQESRMPSACRTHTKTGLLNYANALSTHHVSSHICVSIQADW